jgi:NitT/TauT family transport system substrate-binding protein
VSTSRGHRRRHLRRHLAGSLAVLGAAAILLGGCGSSPATAGGTAPTVTVRLGYLPNLTHAPAIVGVDRNMFASALGSSVHLQTQTFNAGPDAVTAIFGGAIDAAFIGPNPAINAYVKSSGSLVRIVSGATYGGAGLVVRPGSGITSAASLRGKTLATPQLGNTQDVALRAYLAANGMHTTPQGGGDVSITPTDNATILQLFKQGQIDGAWVPEPYLSRLITEAGGRLLVDEASLWPNGQFPTTVLVVTTQLLDAHPDVVRRLVQGNLAAIDWINANPAQAKLAVNDALRRLTTKALATAALDLAWTRLHFSVDPLPAALVKAAADAHTVGLLAVVDLHGILQLRPLNDALRAAGRATVSSAGYGLQ